MSGGKRENESSDEEFLQNVLKGERQRTDKLPEHG